MKKKAAGIIDKWKLAIFSRHLREAGYSYDTCEGLTPDTLTITVEYTDVSHVQQVLLAAAQECERTKKWFIVIATRSVCSDTMQYDMYTEINVYASSPQAAMKAVRSEFRFAHLEVKK